MGEKLIIDGNRRSDETKFSILRSGNILCSSGSVVPLFKDLLEKDKGIKITHKDMTRFFIGIEKAVNMLVDVTPNIHGGEIFIMKMPSLKIIDIANVLLEHYEKDESYLGTMGLREGEKLSEDLVTEQESEYLYEYNENFYVLCLPDTGTDFKKLKLIKCNDGRYSSDRVAVNREETKNVLKINNII